jgi:hypothetical protein
MPHKAVPSDMTYPQALLEGLAEDLKLPFLQIKSRLELLGMQQPELAGLAQLEISTQYGLRLIESYSLALELKRNPKQLELEPFGVGAVLQDAAHSLAPYAKQYDTELIVDIAGAPKPILMHRRSLLAAFYCLGTSLIRAQIGQQTDKGPNSLVLGAHGLKEQRMALGAFASLEGITNVALRSARQLQGIARQPLSALGAQTAGGIFIADLLLQAVEGQLHAARHGSSAGLAAHFNISKQIPLL